MLCSFDCSEIGSSLLKPEMLSISSRAYLMYARALHSQAAESYTERAGRLSRALRVTKFTLFFSSTKVSANTKIFAQQRNLSKCRRNYRYFLLIAAAVQRRRQ